VLSKKFRRNFLNYFKQHHHQILPSSSVIPHEDPSLFFTNAGMNQFKKEFLGKGRNNYTKVATAQKCIRVGGKHNDLDNVGHTNRHLTFFEMLGNFSFGEYFKKEAIDFAWQVTTDIFEFDPDRIWVTFFKEDEEAFEIWKKKLPEHRLIPMDEKENFWSMGTTGPCGPCSELYYDKGDRSHQIPSLQADTEGERYLEFWNLVFMQFDRDSSGKMLPLPTPSIDTGAGLERLVSIKMGVDNLFATDILRELISKIEEVTHKVYRIEDEKTAPAFHVIADHLRSLSFAIADGAQPSNVEGGYILRKLLRRAARYGRILDKQRPFLSEILPRLVELMGEEYGELQSAESRIGEILTLEEESFLCTLKRGGNLINEIISKERKGGVITGEEAFKLKDTYGLPLEEILLIAKDCHLSVNLDAYQLLEEEAKERSKAARNAKKTIPQQKICSTYLSQFVGYQELEIKTKIQGILVEGTPSHTISAGKEGVLFLEKTPFYAEQGGQVGDTGSIFQEGNEFHVSHTQFSSPGVIGHAGKVVTGSFQIGDPVIAQVNSQLRKKIENNHTATHLLHWALNEILGSHIRQAGSFVSSEGLRLDVHHHHSLSREEKEQVEELVNEKIRENRMVEIYEISYEEAQKRREIKQFFGEKYGNEVRVVDIGSSKELCGGTHAHQTGNIGYFHLIKEGSVAAGTRRIEAVTGKEAERSVQRKNREYEEKVSLCEKELAQMHQKLKKTNLKYLKVLANQYLNNKEQIGNLLVLSAIVPIEPGDLLLLAEEMVKIFPSGILLLACENRERYQVILKISPELVQRGWHAGDLLKKTSTLLGGSGGGGPASAQGGGRSGEKLLDKLFFILRKWISEHS